MKRDGCWYASTIAVVWRSRGSSQPGHLLYKFYSEEIITFTKTNHSLAKIQPQPLKWRRFWVISARENLPRSINVVGSVFELSPSITHAIANHMSVNPNRTSLSDSDRHLWWRCCMKSSCQAYQVWGKHTSQRVRDELGASASTQKSFCIVKNKHT